MKRPTKRPRDAEAAVAPVEKSRHLQVHAAPGKTRDQLLAEVLVQGVTTNASTALRFASIEYGDLSLTDMALSLREHGAAVNRGDLAAAERMLNAQAVALNAMFGEMARVAYANVFKSPEWGDRYMRLALKAQSQSRATIETLAAMKNPPVVFARQANVSNGRSR